MKYILLLVVLCSIGSGCDKRKCECKGDVNFEAQSTTFNVTIPNAVNESCSDFAIQINSKTEIDFSKQTINLSQDNISFIEGMDLNNFIEKEIYVTSVPIELSGFHYYLSFPIDLFEDSNGQPIQGEMNFNIDLINEDGEQAAATGTTYFYRCEDIDMDFDAADCLWPSQVSDFYEYSVDCSCR